jgi:O-acetylserine/cysteine efflux transporter
MSNRDSIRALLTVIVWGVNFVVLDEGLKGFPPFVLLTLRFIFVVFPLILFIPRPGPWKPILMIGLFMNLGQFSLLYLAMKLGMPAGLSSLVLQAQVVFGIVISQIVLGEHASTKQIVGVAAGMIGLIVVSASYGSHASIWPLIVTLGAALCWAIGNIFARRAQITSGLGLVVWAGLVVPLPALVFALLDNGSAGIGHALAQISWTTVWSTAYTVIASTLFGYYTWNSLLARYPVSSVVPFALLVPIAGIGAAWVALGQVPTALEVVGGVTLLAGVAIATVRAPARSRTAVPPTVEGPQRDTTLFDSPEDAVEVPRERQRLV